MIDELTHLVLVYQCLGLYLDLLLEEINIRIYLYPGRSHELPEEEWGDFFLSIQQRVISLVNGFEYRGYSFCTYLNNTLQWHLKSHRRSIKRRNYDDWILERESVLEFPKMMEPGGYGYELNDKLFFLIRDASLPEKRTKVFQARLFFLILKNIIFLGEGEYLECAEVLGVPCPYASRCRICLLDMIRERCCRQEILTQRRNNCYHRATYCEKQLSEYADSSRMNILREDAQHYCRKKSRINDQIRRINILPTNREIAQVLDLPKGSVDSGLYYLKDFLQGLKGKGRLPDPGK